MHHTNTGRRRTFLGVKPEHLRIKYTFGGHSRGFYARYRPALSAWECQLSGYGMRPARWFSPSQTAALCRLRLTPSLWRYTPQTPRTSHYDAWDGIPDQGDYLAGAQHRLDFA